MRFRPALALAVGAVMLAGAAPAPPDSAAAPASATAAAACPIDVMAVMPLPGNGMTATYAAVLASPSGAGTASGTLWVNTTMGPFHVPFTQRAVLGKPYTSGDDPILFAVPAAASLTNVFVDALAGAPPCPTPGAWAPPFNAFLEDNVKRALSAALKTTTGTPAPVTSISDPAAACHVPDTAAYMLKAEPVYGAPDLRGGTVRVRVHLSADSQIVSAEVEDPNSDVRYYNTRALNAARASIYVTRTVNCRPVESDFLFPAVFP
jgi:hypothetical protein